jgi:hypothetical protein
MNKQINLPAYRAELQRKIEAIDLILGNAPTRSSGISATRSGRRGWSEAAKLRLAAIARARWKKAKAAGKNAL